MTEASPRDRPGATDVVIPIVGECDDSLPQRRGRPPHPLRARLPRHRAATGGRSAEGSVGAGTGMITCDFKGGIGTSSRRIPVDDGCPTRLGVLVLTNFGVMPATCASTASRSAELLEPDYREVLSACTQLRLDHRRDRDRRAAVVVAAGAPVQARGARDRPRRIVRGARLGRDRRRLLDRQQGAADRQADDDARSTCCSIRPSTRFYEAVIECTEEAIVNALCLGGDMTGQGGNFAPGLPADRVAELLRQNHASEIPPATA